MYETIAIREDRSELKQKMSFDMINACFGGCPRGGPDLGQLFKVLRNMPYDAYSGIDSAWSAPVRYSIRIAPISHPLRLQPFDAVPQY